MEQMGEQETGGARSDDPDLSSHAVSMVGGGAGCRGRPSAQWKIRAESPVTIRRR
ncbi:hypothetical protein Ppa06_68850 [Planomonospora parontospora subsp. parontospora]|uniref:Uncharacterized protein n=2 Tax=Planomonospora parontospora TaxID=58119 RepID=A0AA37BPK7_9ACTN|nr:hypothetical protein GCM10010126_69600 [Planomonospora parontospora]GII13087.1 hypothetical protein Ppa06_68850 [Planomonospora parontospora subsp. parontospora]